MNYLLDTCVISEMVKPAPSSRVIMWINGIPSERLFLCSLTIGEILKGLTKLPESKKKERLTDWLNTLLENYQDRIHSIDITVAESWGVMQGKAENEGMPMSSIDSLIAATSYTHNLILVTRNEKDFQASKLSIINPWNYEENE
ncbi:MAG: type II toxin-antitoxin system VapC family toxin [Anaerolineales bacterium]|nr:type II toxin-antitoxin system VapC family toxin [Anaerolineales bacterium]